MSLHLVPIQHEDKRHMSDPTETTGVQAVLFALQIMEHVAMQREPIGVTALAEQFGTNKSRIHRHLKTLSQAGYVVQDEVSERYRIGARLIALGHSMVESVDLVREAGAVMRKLRNTLNHSVVLSMVDRGGIRVVSVESGTSPVEITVKAGSLMDCHSTAQGKIALAFGAPSVFKQAIAHGLQARTPQTITNVAELERELEAVRRQGWAVAPNQAVTGLNALAVPIFDASGRLAASVAIVDSVQFIGDVPTVQQIDAVIQAGEAISRSIGFKIGRAMRQA
jgi:IclR family transcriptional regulator, KDG regulon repressor